MLRSKLLLAVPLTLALGLVSACSDDASDPNASSSNGGSNNTAGGGAGGTTVNCEEGMKPCDGLCVALDEARFGCAATTCTPCFAPNASASCDSQGQCALAECDAGFSDCDADPGNGCEAELDTDRHNCGACDNFCMFDHGQGDCSSGVCTLLICDPGWADCTSSTDGGSLTGEDCETNVANADDCGACGVSCGAGQVCSEDTALGQWLCSGGSDAGADAGDGG